MTNRDRFSKLADLINTKFKSIVFILSVGILFVVMFITLPEDVNLARYVKPT